MHAYHGQEKLRNQDLQNYSVLIPVLSFLNGFLVAIPIFCYLGYAAKLEQLAVGDINFSTADIFFIVIP